MESEDDIPRTPPSESFFSGSEPEAAGTISSGSSAHGHDSNLFFPDSDDEDSSKLGEQLPILKRKLNIHDEEECNDYIMADADQISLPSDDLPVLDPFPGHILNNVQPVKKRRMDNDALSTTPSYIGEFIVPNAWSSVSGHGYITRDEEVYVKRINTATSKDVKSTVKGVTKDGKRQLSLATMLKGQSSKTSSKQKKINNVVYLANKNGTGAQLVSEAAIRSNSIAEFGRLPMKMSSWMARLLDFGTSTVFFPVSRQVVYFVAGIVEFRGIMTDCPDKLSAGASLLVALKAYIRPNAFTPLKPFQSNDSMITLREDLETIEERLVFTGRYVIRSD